MKFWVCGTNPSTTLLRQGTLNGNNLICSTSCRVIFFESKTFRLKPLFMRSEGRVASAGDAERQRLRDLGHAEWERGPVLQVQQAGHLPSWVQGSGCRVQGAGCRVQGKVSRSVTCRTGAWPSTASAASRSPYTHHPTPQTLKLKLQTLKPEPSTLNPKS